MILIYSTVFENKKSKYYNHWFQRVKIKELLFEIYEKSDFIMTIGWNSSGEDLLD